MTTISRYTTAHVTLGHINYKGNVPPAEGSETQNVPKRQHPAGTQGTQVLYNLTISLKALKDFITIDS